MHKQIYCSYHDFCCWGKAIEDCCHKFSKLHTGYRMWWAIIRAYLYIYVLYCRRKLFTGYCLSKKCVSVGSLIMSMANCFHGSRTNIGYLWHWVNIEKLEWRNSSNLFELPDVRPANSVSRLYITSNIWNLVFVQTIKAYKKS